MSYIQRNRVRWIPGFWRVLSVLVLLLLVLPMDGVLAQGGGAPPAPPPPPAPDMPRRAAKIPPITVNNGHLMQTDIWQPFEVRGVNYVVRMGVDEWQSCLDVQFGSYSNCLWDSTILARDMDLLQAQGVNTIRVFLNYYAFGGFQERSQHYHITSALYHFQELLDVANSRGIYVIPVLLAKYPQDSGLTEHDFETAMQLHVRPVVRHFADHSGILGWDLFNEPDIAGPVDPHCWDWDNADFPLCFNLASQRLLFLHKMRDEVKQIDPYKPVTVSVAFAKNYFRPNGAYYVALADLVDFYAIHYYDNDPYDCGRYAQHWYYGGGFPHDLERSIDELRSLGLNKPIVITEIGFPSGEGTYRTLEETQRDLRTAVAVARNKQIDGVVLWPFQRRPVDLMNNIW